MELQSNENEKALRSLIQKSRLNMPFSDFEARLMHRIKTEAPVDKSVRNNIRLSWLFFGLGTIFGLLCATILVQTDTQIFGLSLTLFTLPLYILGGLIFFWQLEHLLQFSKRKKKTNSRFF